MLLWFEYSLRSTKDPQVIEGMSSPDRAVTKYAPWPLPFSLILTPQVVVCSDTPSAICCLPFALRSLQELSQCRCYILEPPTLCVK